ncbi:MAG: hypothetical protein ACPGJF_07530 [Sinimarinibacterium flocculans]|uniref:hypothetical protein n=1 Tax=Sinimarinibacterium flocculans TaxID=985250 RepID=UPI003C3398F1
MPPKRSPRTFTALLLALGMGLCAYYGQEWWALPDYSAADIEASVELNLQLELQRRGPHLQPDEAGIARLRDMVEREITAQLTQQREKIQLRFGVGLVALVLGLGQLAMARVLGQKSDA